MRRRRGAARTQAATCSKLSEPHRQPGGTAQRVRVWHSVPRRSAKKPRISAHQYVRQGSMPPYSADNGSEYFIVSPLIPVNGVLAQLGREQVLIFPRFFHAADPFRQAMGAR